MTEREIQKLLVDEPQKLIDDAVVFTFNEVDGNVKLIDGVAAGGPWMGFEFIDGPFAGKKIYCCSDGTYEHDQKASFEYLPHTMDDGMLFNKDPAELGDADEENWGGDYVPELSGTIFTIR